jgi:hypothetical protein
VLDLNHEEYKREDIGENENEKRKRDRERDRDEIWGSGCVRQPDQSRDPYSHGHE